MMEIFGISLGSSDLLGIAGTLAGILIVSVVRRSNAALIERRKLRSETISILLSPFHDALASIELGSLNHIRIMRTFHVDHLESVVRTKAMARKSRKAKIEKAWNDYKQFYDAHAKDSVHSLFAAFPPDVEENMKCILRQHIASIISAIKSA